MAKGAPVPSSFFDAIGMKYEEAFGHDHGLIDFVKLALDTIPTKQEKSLVLDIGCGTGKPVASMIAASGRKVHGIDNSSIMVALSRKQVPEGTFEEISMLDYQPPASVSFDSVFAMFCFFNLGGDLVGPLMNKINEWTVSNGYLFIGTMVADDFDGESVQDSEDQFGGRHVVTRFMGQDAATLVYSKEGWASMLLQAGFEILHSKTVPFQAPAEADCGLEQHHYIVARKIRSK